MPRRSRRALDERGETLAEILVTISIMGIAFVAILGAIGVSVMASDVSRKEGTAEALLRSSAEQVQQAPYVDCASTSSYPVASASGSVTVSITSVKYWDGTSTNPATFGGSCPVPVGDQGVQSIDLKAQANDGRATETLTIFKREP
jgi:type II secretory pathway pseudopilin PulG